MVGDSAGTFFGVTVDSGAALVLDDDLTASSLTSNGNTTFGDGVTFFGMGNTYVNGAGSTDTFGDNAGGRALPVFSRSSTFVKSADNRDWSTP